MTELVSATELARRFSDYLNRVAYRGERFEVVRGGRRIAELGPVAQAGTLGDLGRLLERAPRLGAGDAEAFEADVSEARAALPPEANRWES